jgi:hypothetical protein
MSIEILIIDGQISRKATPKDVLGAPILFLFLHSTYVGFLQTTDRKINEYYGITCNLKKKI